MVFVAAFAAIVALHLGQVILAPVFLAIVVGLMFGPVADLLERRGVPDAVSAGVVVLLFLLVLAGGMVAFAAPLGEWIARIPTIWRRIQTEIANWHEPLAAIGAMQAQVKDVLGGEASVTVAVEDGGPVQDAALLIPAILGQMLIFLASLYFFLATRDNIRLSALSLCVTRRLRWRMAHVFRDVEQKVSRYLLTISVINIGVGVVVTLAMWAIGMPSPLLWGAMAAVLNYIPFVGQAVMALILFLVGMATSPGLFGAMLPVVIYWVVNFIEGNFVSPNLLGRTMTINPLMIFLALAFWLWTWGPVGGLIAVPSLLILYSIATHILPMRDPISLKAEKAVSAKAAADVERNQRRSAGRDAGPKEEAA